MHDAAIESFDGARAVDIPPVIAAGGGGGGFNNNLSGYQGGGGQTGGTGQTGHYGGGAGGFGGGGGGRGGTYGGGGGSFNGGTNQIQIAGENTGNGTVTIQMACVLRGTRIGTLAGVLPLPMTDGARMLTIHATNGGLSYPVAANVPRQASFVSDHASTGWLRAEADRNAA